jgi:hypothetical protein
MKKQIVKNDRHMEWIENSHGLMHVEMLLVGNAQGLGLLDVELIEEFPKLKVNSKLEKYRLTKLRHITLSELWFMGVYELIRLLGEMMPKRKMFSEKTKIKLKETLKEFTEVRVPLVKFQDWGKKELYSGVSTPTFDSVKGFGWKIHYSRKNVETKIFYRRDLSDSFLELLRLMKEDTIQNAV